MGYGGHPDAGLVRKQLQRILESESFARSERLCEFLKFIVESALDGRADELKEYVIALSVFHRPESYDPKIDSLVRVEASKLRSKLALYYDTEGRGDEVRIEIPKGSYAPSFREAARERQAIPKRGFRVAAIASVVAAILIFLVAYPLANTLRPASQPAGMLSLAVLPFVDLTPSKDKESLCDGLTEELITSLANLPGVQIASRTSAFQYKGNTADIRRVGDALNVQAVMEGSLQMEGGRIRVITQLITTSDGFHIWTDTYDGEVERIGDVPRQIAGAILHNFRMDLKSTRRALVRPPSRSVEAWRQYIHAEQLRVREPLKAVEFYQVAVAEDPDYALAWAGMALALVTAADWGEVAPADVLPKAAEAVRRALAADDTYAESHLAAAMVEACHKQDWVAAEREFRRATEIDPAYLEARLEYARQVLLPRGRFSQGVQELTRALALYPDSNLVLNALGNAYIKARQYEKAREPLQASQRISPSLAAWVYLGMAEAGLGRHEEALQRFHAAASLRRTPWVIGHLGYSHAKLGHIDDARKAVTELEERREGRPANDYEVAAVHAALGNSQAAFAALDRAVASQPLEMMWLKVDYRFDDLRADPRFSRLVRKLRLE